MALSDAQAAVHRRLQTELFYFAENAPLIIKTKAGKLVPLKLNKAQRFIHDQCEDQIRRCGFVRKIIVKARQEGASTYIGARFYHKTTRIPGTSTFILAHDGDTTAKLFNMVKRFQENVHQSLQPHLKASNRKELKFEDLDSDYVVGTAGNDTGGRGGTVQLFHGSEVAYWSNTDEIEKGVMESVPLLYGTEMILESTANGIGNMFHSKAMAALSGKGDYELIFIPWFWMEEYARQAPSDFTMTAEEIEYQELYELTLEQMAWRQAKILTFGNGDWQRGLDKFKQEYPANVHEAFESSGSGLIKPMAIMKARKSNVVDKNAPLIMGVDPARDGDRTVIVFRRGREIPKFYKWEEMDSMRLAGIVAKFIEKHNPAAVFIDRGEGHGTIDRLHELGFDDVVHGIHFGEGASMPDIYANKRAEMWIELRDWLEAGDCSIPDDDEFHKDLAIMPNYKDTSSGKKQLVSKDKIKEEFKISPDIGDAAALTFAQPVRLKSRHHGNQEEQKTSGGLRTLGRVRKAA